VKLNIRNKTWYRTSDLRKLITAALKAEGQWDDWGRWMVNVTYSRAPTRISGWGYYNCRHIMSLHLPKTPVGKGGPSDDLPADMVVIAAQVLVHEIGHNIGLRHEDMVDHRGIAVPWAEGLQVRRVVSTKKATLDERVSARAKHVDAKVLEIEKKLETVKTREKKLRGRLREWKRKQSYYLKKAAVREEKA
jgi:hypothetical protein